MNDRTEIKIADVDRLNEGINRLTVDGVELVAVKRKDEISVFSGVCLHAEGLLANGFLDGDYLTCGSHLWRYHLKTGELDGEPGIFLKKLEVRFSNNEAYIDIDELEELRDDD